MEKGETFTQFCKKNTWSKKDEVERLRAEVGFLERSPYVKLAAHEQEILRRMTERRDELLCLYNRGQALVGMGWTFDMMEGWADAED